MATVLRVGTLTLLLCGGAGAYAGACIATTDSLWDDTSLARVAVRALAATVQELEPALPRTRTEAVLPPRGDDGLVDAFRYLRERRLLPSTFDLDAFDAVAWQEGLDAFLASYGLPGVPVGPARTPDDLRADLERVVERVLAVVRPVALLAWDPQDDARLAFVGVVWNWSPYPRLLVWRVPEDWSMRDGARQLANRIAFCGRPVTDWVSASAPVARALFMTHADDAAMYLVGSEPETRAWPYRVERGDEVAVFAFEHPEVADVAMFSAVFAGEPIGVLELARIVPQVRTNLSPVGLARVMQTPPRRD